ncbi:hypothetical protein PbB2_02262 [Candidatus Phycosocius bacilliformis]|uniref:DUF2147 domain-containing protein n=2 Tax=Candidatus Phycosocius bacilliformis TaxID=1445552 RepID=A0A2P2EBX9_9PROT|nr:hypothetical protein PbB2_02262 [Candidatus Phycosocius bacilliformis]
MSVLLIVAIGMSSTAGPISGRWHTPENKAIVEIAPCGAQLCGTIVSAVPLPRTTTPPLDTHNPDPALRNRLIIGMRLLSGFVPGRGNWTGGTIYNPVNGKTYKAVLTLMPDGQLKVSGCVAFLCQDQFWRRAK